MTTTRPTYTTSLDRNGNRKARVTVESIGNMYATFCNGARVEATHSSSFDAVLGYLKTRFGYRMSMRAAIPAVITFYEGESVLISEILDAIVYAATGGAINISRYRYMNCKARPATHDQYYGQFIGENEKASAARDAARLLKSLDPHLNDVRDYTKTPFTTARSAKLCLIAESTTYVNFRGGSSLSNSVCIAKAAARMVISDAIAGGATKVTQIQKGLRVVEHFNGFNLCDDDGDVITVACAKELHGDSVVSKAIACMFYAPNVQLAKVML